MITRANYIIRPSFKARGEFADDLLDEINVIILLVGYADGDIPIIFNQVSKSLKNTEWIKAIAKEFESYLRNNIWEEILVICD